MGAVLRLVYNPAFAALIGPRHTAQFGQPVHAAGALPQAERFALPSDDAELWLFWPPDPLCACGIDATTLRHATETNLLGVSYQPQIRMSDGAVAGFESLDNQVHSYSTHLILLDRSLSAYGPDADPTRRLLARYVELAIANPARLRRDETLRDYSSEHGLTAVGDALAVLMPADAAAQSLLDDIRQQYQRLVGER